MNGIYLCVMFSQACVKISVHRGDGHCSRRYASYWNVFLFTLGSNGDGDGVAWCEQAINIMVMVTESLGVNKPSTLWWWWWSRSVWTSHQHYGDGDGVAWCEQAINIMVMVTESLGVNKPSTLWWWWRSRLVWTSHQHYGDGDGVARCEQSHQHYGDGDRVTWCEQAINITVMVTESLSVNKPSTYGDGDGVARCEEAINITVMVTESLGVNKPSTLRWWWRSRSVWTGLKPLFTSSKFLCTQLIQNNFSVKLKIKL